MKTLGYFRNRVTVKTDDVACVYCPAMTKDYWQKSAIAILPNLAENEGTG